MTSRILLVHDAGTTHSNSSARLATGQEAIGAVHRLLRLTDQSGTYIPVPDHDLTFETTNSEDWCGSWVSWGDAPKAGWGTEDDPEGRDRLTIDGREISLPTCDDDDEPESDEEYEARQRRTTLVIRLVDTESRNDLEVGKAVYELDHPATL